MKGVQKVYFSVELSSLKSSWELKCKSSRFIQLSSFIDKEGVIHIDGCLRNANIHENSKHPVLLPKKGHITDVDITRFHINQLHAGQELLISWLGNRFWILSVRTAVRKIIHRCLTCIRYRGKTVTQLMGDLPSTRVKPSTPFSTTGVDYTGLYVLKSQVERRSKPYKCYISIFVCYSAKAIHLELVT